VTHNYSGVDFNCPWFCTLDALDALSDPRVYCCAAVFITSSFAERDVVDANVAAPCFLVLLLDPDVAVPFFLAVAELDPDVAAPFFLAVAAVVVVVVVVVVGPDIFSPFFLVVVVALIILGPDFSATFFLVLVAEVLRRAVPATFI
jgi:hypothetical protein